MLKIVADNSVHSFRLSFLGCDASIYNIVDLKRLPYSRLTQQTYGYRHYLPSSHSPAIQHRDHTPLLRSSKHPLIIDYPSHSSFKYVNLVCIGDKLDLPPIFHYYKKAKVPKQKTRTQTGIETETAPSPPPLHPSRLHPLMTVAVALDKTLARSARCVSDRVGSVCALNTNEHRWPANSGWKPVGLWERFITNGTSGGGISDIGTFWEESNLKRSS